MSGWIKLHRKLMESDTFTRLTAIQKVIAIYIVLNANHSDGIWYDKYKGIEVEVKRGQLVTSRNKIVKEWFENDKDVTEQKVRTCLDKLEKLGFLTKCSANDYTIITVLNYEVYQGSDMDDNQEVNQVLTKPQPSGNQAITTNKNYKNYKNDKKEELKDICPESLTEIQDESSALIPILETVKYGLDNTYYKMSIYFKSVVDEMAHKEGLEHLTKNANLQTWSNDFRKLVELDKQKDTHLIKSVMDWVVKDSFWKGNVLSAATFRKQFPKLAIAMNKGSKPKIGTSGKEIIPIAQDSGAPVPTEEEFQQMIEFAKQIQSSKEGQRA